MKAVIFGQKWKEEHTSYIKILLEKLNKEGIDYRFSELIAKEAPEGIEHGAPVYSHEELQVYSPDLIITLTIL